MKRLSNVLTDFLNEDKVRFIRSEGGDDFFLNYYLKTVSVNVVVRVDEEDRAIGVFVRSGMLVPPERRAACAELIVRMNRMLRIGAFQFDYDEGDIYGMTSLFVGDNEIETALLRPVVHAPIQSYGAHYPAFVDVVYREMEPLAALERLEQARQAEVESGPVPAEIDAVVQRLLQGILADDEGPKKKKRRRKKNAGEAETDPKPEA